MLNKILKNNIFLTFLVGIIVFGIIWIFSLIFVNIDKNFSDKLYSFSISKNLRVSKNIVLVTIDDESIKKIGQFPFSRSDYTPVIDNLSRDGVSVIGMDIIFADKGPDKNADTKLEKSFEKANNIVIGGGIIGNKKGIFFQKPFKPFEKSVLSYGYFQPQIDRNGKVYSLSAHNNYKNGVFYHFSIQILKAYYAKLYEKDYLNFNKKSNKYFYLTENIKVPAKNGKEININFVKEDSKFYKIPFYKIYNNNYDHNFFKNKIIIIGYTAKGFKDIFFTPEGQKFGVYTHANLVNTVLTKQYKIYFDKKLELVLIFFLIILSVYFNISQRGNKLLIANITIISIFIILIFFITCSFALNYPIQFLFALIITLTISNILKSAMEDKNKSLLNKALSQYVSKDIANEILYGEGKINLDGERKNISIFFSDIEGFTTISEKMNPEELVIFLREYLGAMSNIIMDQKGLIDKYEGDAIMALWGVFGKEENSTYNNCFSAIEQQKKLKILNIDWKKRFGEELKIRMGLNTGEAIVGNIGAEGRKMEFTALGDSVNLASRLEEVNKKYGTYLCASEIVFQEQKDNFDFRYLDQIKVKGKNIPVKIYELISIKGEIDNSKKEIILEFEKAIKLYLNKDFEEALNIFEKLEKLGDNPSKTYIGRCKIFIENSPEKDWDGVWTMISK